MRISNGTLKNKNLSNTVAPSVRPTKVRIKQAIFNILKHRFLVDFEQTSVLDGFAGTGMFGFEALSHGAKHVAFVENDYKTANLIRQNAKTLGVSCDVYHCDLINFKPNMVFDLVFLDPPYFKGLIVPAVLNLVQGGFVKDGIICIECARKEFAEVHEQLQQSGIIHGAGDSSDDDFVYRYGNIIVAFYTHSLNGCGFSSQSNFYDSCFSGSQSL
ncbi:MAG: RsmD family RNA methyltransferase [Holosporales bacterium]|jgi:16S rRNA (guanine966-N2)-methyltransferase|nr:RsmD family RNA methyltransferase [Holosporales bacterium]